MASPLTARVIRFDLALHEALRETADDLGVSANWLVNRLCQEGLENMGREHNLPVHDLIVHHTGSGPGGHNIFTALRARRCHSYLLVFNCCDFDGGPDA